MFERSLQRLRENDPSLTELDLSYKNIGDDGVKSISDALRKNTSLITLYLTKNDIGDDGVKSLSNTLHENTTLTELILDYNKIGDDGVKSLSAALRASTSLTALNLVKNMIRDEGAKSLSDALRTNTSLTILYLDNNKIRDEGAKSFSDILRTNTTLTEINLYENYIGAEGKRELQAALSQNGSLITPVVHFNNEMDRYAKRNRRAQNKAREAVFAILVIGKLWDLKDDRFKATDDDSDFEKFLRQTGSEQRKSYFFQAAKELWNTRHEHVWWTEQEREEAKRVLEKEREEAKRVLEKENKLVQTCIASHICDNKATLMEASDPTQVFCSSYCQFMHYTGAPDLRGMNVEQIKRALN